MLELDSYLVFANKIVERSFNFGNLMRKQVKIRSKSKISHLLGD